jgi:carbon storage regulator
MLVLTRKVGERIYIGDGITVTVLELKGTRVRLGVDAPGDVRIVRSELVEFADDRRSETLEPEGVC